MQTFVNFHWCEEADTSFSWTFA